MHDESMSDAMLERRLEQALDRRPAVEIAADFASRVAAQAPVRPTLRVRVTHYGRDAMIAGLVVLLVAILAFAQYAMVSRVVDLTIEWTLCLQFVLLALWLGWRRVPR